MSATQDFVALDWIKGEIGQTLGQAKDALEAMAEAPDDLALMRPCLTALHQVHGTLRMVELIGPTLLSQEMEALAQALMNSNAPDVQQAQEVLMQAILQMPTYLDKIQREQVDGEANYLALANALRAARGEELLPATEAVASEQVAAGYNLAPLTEPADAAAMAAYVEANGRATIHKLRARFQQSLLAIVKKEDLRENLGTLAKVFTMAARVAGQSPAGELAQIAVAMVEAIVTGAVKLSSANLALLRQVDAELKRLVEGGDEAIREPVSADVATGMLDALKDTTKRSARMTAVLERFDGGDTGADAPADFGIGPDDETLAAVSKILIEELNVVTDKLDLFVRSSDRSASVLQEMLPNLEQIASTLVVVGMADHQATVARQIEQVKSTTDGGDIDDEFLLDMAKDLLGIEASLGGLTGDSEDGGDSEAFGDLDDAQAAVIRETRNGLAQCKDAVIEFVTSEFAADKLTELPDSLRSLRGGLLIANQERAGEVLTQAADYVADTLMTGGGEPTLSDMDDLADAITSVDYYLERLLENPREPYLQMLEVAETAIGKLQSSAPGTDELAIESGAATDDTEQPDLEDTEEAVAAQDVAQEPAQDIVAEDVHDEVDATDGVDELVAVEETATPAVAQDDAVDDDVLLEVEDVAEPAAQEMSVEEPAEALDSETDLALEDLTDETGAEAPVEDEPVIEAGVAVSDADDVEFELEALDDDADEFAGDEVSVAEDSAEAVSDSPQLTEPEPEPETVAADDGDDLIDDEILEIFIEEAEEVLETINEYFPQWRADPGNDEARTELRRAFHTLKGSGRMVGATVLGELAWSVENMLNRVIDETISVSDNMMAVIADVVARIPEGVALFRDNNQHAFDVVELSAAADAIARGETPAESLAESPAETLAETLAETEVEATAEDDPVADVTSAALESQVAYDATPEDDVAPDDAFADAGSDSAAVEDDFALDTIEELDLDGTDAVADELLVAQEDAATEPSVEPEMETPAVEPNEPEPGLESDAAPEPALIPELDAEELAADEELSLEEIFALEANEKLQEIRVAMQQPGPVSAVIVAAFHTLKGSAGMAEVPGVVAIAAPMEKLTDVYLQHSLDVDDSLIELMVAAHTGISTIVADLENLRYGASDSAELVARINTAMAAATAGSTADQPAGFDFTTIRLLPLENVVTVATAPEQRSALIAELDNVLTQAGERDQLAVTALASAVRRIYFGLAEVPAAATLDLLRRAHEQLVIMFDQIAASQEIVAATALVNELEQADPAATDAAEEVVAEEVVADVPVADEGGSAEPAIEPEVAVVPAPAASESVALPEDDVDADILPIFLEESEELLEGIDQSILDWSTAPTELEHLDLLLRHLHTLKGGARMAGMNSLGEYTHNFETMLIGLRQAPDAFDEAFFGQVNVRQDEITRRVEIYQKLASGQASDEELASMRYEEVVAATPVQAVGDDTPRAETTVETPQADAEPLPADDIDEDVLPIFLEESEELVEEIDLSIQAWSQLPDDTEPYDNLLRQLHTLKGGARMAGLNSLGEYTHNFETYLIGIRTNPVAMDAAFFALVNQRQDEITRRVEIYNRIAAGEASAEEIASLTVAVAATTSADVSPVPEQTVAAEAADSDTPTAAAAAQTQEMVRVSADLLESLIGLSGESSITRGRVEQQISDFGDAIEEMEATIGRVREHVRRLEIEAESRETLIRSQATESDSAFDDLELDRYTMLQEISRALSEGTSDMLDLKDTLVNRSRDAETLLHQQARIGSELQEGLTRTRMVPFARLIPRLRRIVRQISTEVGKSVRFDAFNVEGELDRSVLERIVAPLEHMLRNAVDHGIESVDDRRSNGKPEQGRISLRLSREGGYVVLTVSDDGGGINVEAVRNKAIERGLMNESSDLTDHDVMQFILAAGFSTAQKLTQISGRGVGMDVVSSEIKALGGTITIDSTLGVGTEFTIRIPFTVSINRALMVVVREETYAVPLNTIEGIVRVSPYELEAYYQPEAPMFEYAGQPYRLDYMGKILEKAETPNLAGQIAPLPVILARSGDNAVALQVDRVIGSREVVVKSLGPQFSEVGGVAGATVLGDGSVVIILDVMALVRSFDIQLERALAPEQEEQASPNKVRKVMIVDDSVTVRKVTSRLMERQGWDVVTAKDGVDAMNQLAEIYPDIVLLDIEMPKMDGFEVLRSVRRDDRLKDLPIVMITSRTGEKHKQQAHDLGVNRYLGKPFQEASLLETIEEVLSETKSSDA